MISSAGKELEAQIERLVVLASGGAISIEELQAAGGRLEAVGVNSIAYINLMEALEQRLGVLIDPDDDPEYLASVGTIALFVEAQRGVSSAPEG